MLSNIFLQFESTWWTKSSLCPVALYNSPIAWVFHILPAELTAALAALLLASVLQAGYKYAQQYTAYYSLSNFASIKFEEHSYGIAILSWFIITKVKEHNPSLFSKSQTLIFAAGQFIIGALVKNKVPFQVAAYLVFPLGSVLWLVLLCNNIGMLPFAFALTSQLSAALTCSIIIYFTSVLLAIRIRGFSFVTTFLPAGTPKLLYPVLILIEVVSHMSRFISLGVRLAANILAGHLLVKVFAMGVNYLMLCLVSVNPRRAAIYNNLYEHAIQLENATLYKYELIANEWYVTDVEFNFFNEYCVELDACHFFKTRNGLATNPGILRIQTGNVLGRRTRPSNVWNFYNQDYILENKRMEVQRRILFLRAKQLKNKRTHASVIASSCSLLVIGFSFLLPIIIMETAVATLQAYVFFHLSSMYISEAISAKH